MTACRIPVTNRDCQTAESGYADCTTGLYENKWETEIAQTGLQSPGVIIWARGPES